MPLRSARMLGSRRSASSDYVARSSHGQLLPNERALLRSAAVLVRSGRRSFYSTFLPEGEEYLRFDVGCMEAVDDRGREAIRMLEDRLAQSSPVEHHWQTGEILVIDNWRALHGRARTGVAVGRRLLRIMIDG
ncbi:TauD/TfdA family dioxygenase [Mesorhizobium sp.]|uniref:TauD/TfdA family dioxygenase n=1 Tax=Mesorhizobium sp. TaxID=1871066 RepID=UPI0011F68E15|nr:MAG: TauD/TfdA family dioxygenase [Mesorhizobium sp.]